MRILIITPFYAPDIGPSAPLFALLCAELAQRGHQVTVISAVPHYASGKVPPEFRGKWIQKSVENGVEVIRVAVPSLDRSNFTQRIIQLLCFQFGATCASIGLKYDAALITNPALETWLPFTWQSSLRRKPIIYSVFDVYPDVGVKLGIFRGKFIVNLVAFFEQFCLKRSALVQIISDSFRPGLRALGVPDEKMAFVPVWVDTNFIRPLPRCNSFSDEQGLSGRFVVMYAGNIGLSQGLECVLEAAGLLSEYTDIRFVLVGDGAGKRDLQVLVDKLALKNVQFIPFQARERLPEVLASADVSLVLLKRGIGSDSLPSKTFSALASGRPIIASLDEGSEGWNLIQRSQAGICIQPEDADQLAEAILKLKNDPKLRMQMGSNGRQLAEYSYSAAAAAEKFEALLLQTLTRLSASHGPDNEKEIGTT